MSVSWKGIDVVPTLDVYSRRSLFERKQALQVSFLPFCCPCFLTGTKAEMSGVVPSSASQWQDSLDLGLETLILKKKNVTSCDPFKIDYCTVIGKFSGNWTHINPTHPLSFRLDMLHTRWERRVESESNPGRTWAGRKFMEIQSNASNIPRFLASAIYHSTRDCRVYAPTYVKLKSASVLTPRSQTRHDSRQAAKEEKRG